MMLKDICRSRIYFNHEVNNLHVVRDEFKSIISTVPLDVLARMIGKDISLERQRQSIYVTRFRVAGADLQQTIYFPDPDLNFYRATMTGDVMRIESMDVIEDSDEEYVAEAFGIPLYHEHGMTMKNHKQPIGKLLPMDEQIRRDFIRKMSRDYNVYSLGRFATWRNILLDDVLKDIHQIRKMMLQDEYDFHKENV